MVIKSGIQLPEKGKGSKRVGKDGGEGRKEWEGTGRGQEGRERRKNYSTEEREYGRSILGHCLANTAHLSYAFPGLNLLPHFFLSTTE